MCQHTTAWRGRLGTHLGREGDASGFRLDADTGKEEPVAQAVWPPVGRTMFAEKFEKRC